MIRIVIAEDQALVLGALGALLQLEPDITLVAQAQDGAAALEFVAREKPDVLVTDIEMPILSGLEVAERLQAEGSETRVVIVTTFARPGYLRRAVNAGVRGYLLKDSPASLLADAIRGVAAGGRAIAPDLVETASDLPVDPLTSREKEALRLADEGHPIKEIASRLKLSRGTVRNYLSYASTKLGVTGRREAARIARNNGWL
jgi:two-component system response regulator DesR